MYPMYNEYIGKLDTDGTNDFLKPAGREISDRRPKTVLSGSKHPALLKPG